MSTIVVWSNYTVDRFEHLHFRDETAFQLSGVLENRGVVEAHSAIQQPLYAVVGSGAFHNYGQLSVRGGGYDTEGVVFSSGSIENYGVISVHDDRFSAGVGLIGAGEVDNFGSIKATGEGSTFGVMLFATTAQAQVLHNSGVIRAAEAVVVGGAYGGSPGSAVIQNSGRIVGHVASSQASVQLVNTGAIQGMIEFGDGDDLYDGRHGVVRSAGSDFGLVYGGGGADTLIGGKQAEVMYGSNRTEMAATDTGDLLMGRGGDDVLYGDAGADTLVGGRGFDGLFGGDGSDVFVFTRHDLLPGGGVDMIFDLQAQDTVDLSDIDADRTRHGDQAFVLVSAPDGRPGEATLTYSAGSNETLMRLYTDGDGVEDAAIYLKGDQTGFTHFVL